MHARVPRFPTIFALLLSLWVPAKAQVTPPQALLAEADRLAMLYNWPRALPLYADSERESRLVNNPRGVLEARLGWLRAEAYEEPSPELAAEVDKDLRNPIIQGDAELMLRCLTAKAAIEEEVNERPTWEKVQELAKRLNDRRWQARAQAELGIIAFLDGDVATATQALKTALVSLYLQGDMSAAIYYGSIVGNGQVETGQRANLLERLFQAEQVLAPVGRPKSWLQQGTIQAHGVRLATLQRSLQPDEMILEYVLDEPSSFCLHITRVSTAVTMLPAGRKRIEDLVDRYLGEVRSSKTGAETGANLYSVAAAAYPR